VRFQPRCPLARSGRVRVTAAAARLTGARLPRLGDFPPVPTPRSPPPPPPLPGEGFAPQLGATNTTSSASPAASPAASPGDAQRYITIDFPLDGLGSIAIPAGARFCILGGRRTRSPGAGVPWPRGRGAQQPQLLFASRTATHCRRRTPPPPPPPTGGVISPVFTLWVTLFALYVVNVVADYAAASTMAARHIGELR
jgi:hypothetical protein